MSGIQANPIDIILPIMEENVENVDPIAKQEPEARKGAEQGATRSTRSRKPTERKRLADEVERERRETRKPTVKKSKLAVFKWPCTVCLKNCAHSAIACIQCHEWTHYDCACMTHAGAVNNFMSTHKCDKCKSQNYLNKKKV